MKKLLLVALLVVPSMAWGNMNCKSIYDGAYKLMMIRQSGVPMYVVLEAMDRVMEEDKKRKNPNEYEVEHKFTYEAVEMAYRMPNMAFMESAAHTMAVEFANVQYLKCTRLNRK